MTSPDSQPTPAPQPPHRSLILRPQHALQTEVLRTEREELIEDDALNLKDLARIVWKHKWLIAALAGVLGVAGFVHSLRGTPMYRATAQIQIERAAQQVVSFGRDVDAGQNYWDDGSGLQTQIELLRSRALAERVVDVMGLDRNQKARDEAQFGQAEGGGMDASPEGGANAADAGLFGRLTETWRKLNTPAVTNADVLDRDGTVGALMGSVSIEPVRETRLVNIVAHNSNPELAARIANTMAETFIALNLERKVESSVYAKNFLEDQIKVTKAKLEESERLLNEYSKRNSILVLGENSNVATQGFSEVAAALARVEQERIKAEALYNEVLRQPESAPQVLESKAVQTYKEQKAKLEAEYATNLSVFKPEFPKMVQLRTQIAELDARIKAEVNTVVASVKGQFEAARRQEEQLRKRLDESRVQVQTVQDRSVDMNLLKREVDTNREIYDGLLQRLKEVGVTGGLTTNNIAVVDGASTPLFPYSPQPMRNAMIGLALGLLLGLGIAFLRETLDDSIKHADEVEGQFGMPLLGWIPLVKKGRKDDASTALLAVEDPRSPFAEAYRSMRTALQFSTTEGAPKRFMVTSCAKGEGKSTTALALAIAFAQLGKRVLLVDADMRNPSIHRALGIANEAGLSNFLSGLSEGNLAQDTAVPNLSVITAGPTPPDPVELLMGPKFGLLLEKAHELGYEHIIVDGPPMLGIADAVVLGNQIQYIIFTVKAASTRRASIKDSLRRMRHAGLSPMGVVLTHAKEEHTHDYAQDAYYGYAATHQAKAG